MTIQINNDCEISIKPKDYKRLSQGTNFQRGINFLAMYMEILSEGDNEFANNLGLVGEEREHLFNELAAERLQFIKKSPPPGIDKEALNVFCS